MERIKESINDAIEFIRSLLDFRKYGKPNKIKPYERIKKTVGVLGVLYEVITHLDHELQSYIFMTFPYSGQKMSSRKDVYIFLYTLPYSQIKKEYQTRNRIGVYGSGRSRNVATHRLEILLAPHFTTYNVRADDINCTVLFNSSVCWKDNKTAKKIQCLISLYVRDHLIETIQDWHSLVYAYEQEVIHGIKVQRNKVDIDQIRGRVYRDDP